MVDGWDKHWLQTKHMTRTLKYHWKYQNSRPVELQTKCYLARTTVPQNPQRNVSSEANSTPRVLVSGWEGSVVERVSTNCHSVLLSFELSSERPSSSSVEKPWSFSSPHVKIYEKLRPTNLDSNNSILLMFHDFHVVLFCLYLEIYHIWKKNVTFEQVKWQKTWTQHDNQNMSIWMCSHVGFNVKQHIEPKPHGIL